MPSHSAVGQATTRFAYCFADGEAEVVLRDFQVALINPDLRQAGIDVHENRASKTGYYVVRNGIV